MINEFVACFKAHGMRAIVQLIPFCVYKYKKETKIIYLVLVSQPFFLMKKSFNFLKLYYKIVCSNDTLYILKIQKVVGKIFKYIIYTKQ